MKRLQVVLGRSGKLLVLGKNGKTARVLHVTAGLSSAMDHGLVIGLTRANDPSAKTVTSAVNPVTGEVQRHTMRRLTPTYYFVPGMGEVALVHQAGGGYLGVRRSDGKVARSRFRPTGGYLVGDGDGYLVAGDTLQSETLAGSTRWSRSGPYGSGTTSIGAYVYSQERESGTYRVRIRRRSDGAEVGTVPGVFEMQPLAVGQDANQLVRFDGGQVLDTGD